MNILDYVYITQGSNSQKRYSNGNTLPMTQLPFGMNAFVPQTERRGDWFYHPCDRSLEGVRLTHQPCPWIGDFGTFLMMPQAGSCIGDTPSERWSGYRPEDAILKPHYIKLGFLRSRSVFELVPTQRGAVIRVDFEEKTWQPYFSVLRHEENIETEIKGNRVYGNVDYTRHHIAPPDPFRMYFVLEFEGGINKEKCIKAGDEGMHIALNRHSETVKLATSFISYEQAERSLEREVNADFDTLYSAAQSEWTKRLNTVEIKTDNEDMLKTFYSCLYRVFVYPNKMYESDEKGRPIHYDVYSDSVKQGYLYTNNGFWDTYRTVYPLLSVIAPEDNKEMLKGFLQCYRNLGWLPRWNSLREVNCMPGTLFDAVLADGAVKGLLDKDDLKTALEGMLKHGDNVGESFYGRAGIENYLEKGYVSRDIKESVNCNQDYAYGDWCIAQVARLCGEEQTAKRYEARSKNYKNLFDSKTGFMRSRDKDGNYLPKDTFDPYSWGGDYTEGSAWQNSFAVFHDIEGLAALHGGKEKLIKKLDELFEAKPIYSVDGYNREIHEMTEMAAVDFGQCAISNQPSFHLPWLYAALGEHDKTVYWVEKLARNAFSWESDGFPGDEDNGTTSAWYLFAVMGFYPLCPGKPQYIRSKPLADSVTIRGKKLPTQTDAYYNYHDLI